MKTTQILLLVQNRVVGDLLDRLDRMDGIEGMTFPKMRGARKANGADETATVRASAKRFDITGSQFVMQTLFRRSPMTSVELGEAFAAGGRSAKSINSQLHGMKQDGLVKNDANGWMLTKKGRDKARYHNQPKKGK